MTNFFDSLETDSTDARTARQLAQLQDQVALAQAKAPYFAESLKGVDADSLTSLEVQSALRRHDSNPVSGSGAAVYVTRPDPGPGRSCPEFRLVALWAGRLGSGFAQGGSGRELLFLSPDPGGAHV